MLFIPGGLNRMAIGDPVHHRTAKPGDDTDHHADNGAAHRQEFMLPPVPDALDPARAKHRAICDGLILAQQGNNFRNGKNAKPDNHELEAVNQVREIIARHPQLTIEGAFTDGGNEHADPRRDKTLERDTPRQYPHHRQAKDRHHQQFGRFEFQHDGACNQDEHGQERGPDKAAEKRGGKSRRERPCRLTPFGKGEAVQHGGLAG